MHKFREQIDYSTSIEGSTIFFLGYLARHWYCRSPGMSSDCGNISSSIASRSRTNSSGVSCPARPVYSTNT